MDKTGITSIAILLIAAIFFSGCTSISSFPVQSPVSSANDTEYKYLLLSSDDLPSWLVLAGDGPMQESDISGTMKNYGIIKGYRALYADKLPLTDNTDKSKIMEQQIMVFGGANASAMLDDYQKSLEAIKNKNIVVVPLPDPNLGDKSFALKVSTTVDLAGTETYRYVFGFERSGICEILSMDGTPETYLALAKVAERAAGKIR